MTSFLTRFVNRTSLASSYDGLFGRPGIVELLRALPKSTGQREQAAVDYYCDSLKLLCGFQYVSQAVIMDAAKEKIRYFFVFATNSIHGVEVFKGAEVAAAAAQDEIRFQTRLKKRPQFALPFGDPAPKTLRVIDLHKQYIDRMRLDVIRRLANTRQRQWLYDELYGNSMAMPLVTRSDLDRLLRELEPNVRVELDGPRRKKAGLHKNDRVIVTDRNALAKLLPG